MSKLETLTKEQEELMFVTRQEWINKFFETKRINRKQFEEGIKWLYEDMLKKKNPKVIYCESWIEALITISMMKNSANVRDNVRDNVGANVRANVWANVGANVRDNVWDNVWANVGANVRANVGANVWDNVWANVGANVRANVGANVWANVGANVRANVGANVRDNVRDNVWDIFNERSNYLNTYDNFGWVAFYDYFERIGVLENYKFKKYKKLVEAGAFQVYEYENYVFAIEPPVNMSVNEEGRLNNINKKAFEWSDGYGFYYINGLTISEEFFEQLKSKKYSLSDFSKERNEEIKSAVISYIQQTEGEEGIYRFFQENLSEVNTFIDKKEQKYLEGTTGGMNIGVYTLFKGEINDTNVAYVRCYCPSTDRMFFLGVEPKHNNAKDAIASLYQIPLVLKDKIVSISRQGEKFSTIFDIETTSKIKNNEIPIDDLKNYTSISGDRYFELMTYEY